MRLQLDQFGKLKNHIHAVQAVFLFLAWVLTIAVLTREGRSDGRVGWYFGLVGGGGGPTSIDTSTDTILVLLDNPDPSVPRNGTHVVSSTKICQRVRFCNLGQPQHRAVAQCMGGSGIICQPGER